MLELLPVLIFFIAYQQYGLYVATFALMAVTTLSLGYTWWRDRQVPLHKLVLLGVVLVLGGATLWFQDEAYIKWKPTVVYWIGGLVLLVNRCIGKSPLIPRLFTVPLPASVSGKLEVSWMLFLFGMGGLNLWVATHYATATWVQFKVFGTLGVLVVFIFAQALFLSKHITQAPQDI